MILWNILVLFFYRMWSFNLWCYLLICYISNETFHWIPIVHVNPHRMVVVGYTQPVSRCQCECGDNLCDALTSKQATMWVSINSSRCMMPHWTQALLQFVMRTRKHKQATEIAKRKYIKFYGKLPYSWSFRVRHMRQMGCDFFSKRFVAIEHWNLFKELWQFYEEKKKYFIFSTIVE